MTPEQKRRKAEIGNLWRRNHPEQCAVIDRRSYEHRTPEQKKRYGAAQGHRYKRMTPEQKRRKVETAKIWLSKNKDRATAIKRRSHEKLRADLLKAYGGPICVHCGFTDIRALQLDHVNGNGSKQVKELKGRGWKLYEWLRSHGYPIGYQVLCANCNWIKRHEKKEWGIKA